MKAALFALGFLIVGTFKVLSSGSNSLDQKSASNDLETPCPPSYAATDADAVITYNVGQEYASKGKLPKAAECFKKSALEGYAPAEAELGWWDVCGCGGLPVDIQKGITWLEFAAAENNLQAEETLGNLFYGMTKGNSKETYVPRDYSAAIQWYTRAAAQGDAEADFDLGCIYSDDSSGFKNGELAVKWFRKTLVDLDNPVPPWRHGALVNACITYENLMVLYENGDCIPKDQIEALAYGYLAKAHGGPGYDSQKKLEQTLGLQNSLIAQQRSRELLAELDKEKEARH